MNVRTILAAVLVGVVAAWAAAGEGGAFGGKTGPEVRAEAEKALGDESIRAAAKTADSEALLGLAILAMGEARGELYTEAVKADPENGLALLLAHGIEAGADEFIQRDPSNAFGYYLQAYVFLRRDNVLDAVAAMKQGTGCKRFETYQGRTIRAIVKGLDALRLKGAARLVAVEFVSWRRPSVWSILSWLGAEARENAERLPEAERDTVADTLLAMAGQLGDLAEKNPQAKVAQFGALVNAFMIKQAIAHAQKSPREGAYAAAIAALGDYGEARGPSREDWEIDEALAYAFEDVVRGGTLEAMMTGLPASIQEAVGKALADARAAAERFVEAVLREQDEIIEWRLEGGQTPAGIANEHPEIARAAQDSGVKWDEARKTIEGAVPAYKSQQNAKMLGLGLLMYSYDNKGAFPRDLETLVKEGYVKDRTILTSPVSGKPYTYIGGEGKGMRDDDRPDLMILYDEATGPGLGVALFVDGHAELLSDDALQTKIKEQE